jgi:uncharacterized membrane protein YfcA
LLAQRRQLRFDPNQAAGAPPAPFPARTQLITDPLFYLVSAVAVSVLGLSKGGFFGLGVLALPLMSLYVPPLQAAAILVPVQLAQDALTIWTYRTTWSAWNLTVMIPAMVVGIVAGTLLAASLSPAHIRLALGLIAALFVLRYWLSQRFARMNLNPSITSGVIIGAAGGFTTLIANAGGPVWQIHLLPQNLDKFTYAGTLTMLFAASNLMKMPAFAALGQMTFDNILTGTLLLPVAVASNYLGLWLVRRIATELFFRIAYVLMFFIAIELMRSSLTELWRG